MIAYSNTLRVPFLFDDVPRILNESAIRQLWPPTIAMQNSNRPFAQYTFALNYAVNGYDVWGYHALNLSIHLAAALMLFGIVRRSLLFFHDRDSLFHENATYLAFVVAILWVLHPLNTQAVTYIVQRIESLMGLAYLATLYFFIRSQQSNRGCFWAGLSVVACFFGMGCKEVMVTAPLVVLWYDRAYVTTTWKEIASRRLVYYLSLTSTWGILAWSVLHHSADYANGSMLSVPGLTSWTYLLSQSSVIVHYLELSFWPSGQCVYYAWPIAKSIADVWPQLFFVTLILVATIWSIIRYPRVGFLCGSFFLILAPTSSVIPIKDLVVEHRMYLPLTIVIALAVAAVHFQVSKLPFKEFTKSRCFLAIAQLVAISLGVTTWERNTVYQSEISVWTDAVAKSPRNTSVWVGLGGIYSKMKIRDEARKCFLKALEIDPGNATAHSNYAGFLIELQEYATAQHHLERAISLDPTDAIAIANLGHLLFDNRNYQAAIPFYQAAVKHSPNDEELQSSLIASLNQDGRIDEAVELCEQQVKLKPNSSRARADLGASLAAIGRIEEAIQNCQTAIQLDDQLARAHATLASIVTDRDMDMAIRHLEIACKLEPNSFEFNRMLANMLAPTRPHDAIKYYNAALAMNPNDVELLLRLGMAWDACGEPATGLPYLERVTKLLPEWTEARMALEAIRRSIDK